MSKQNKRSRAAPAEQSPSPAPSAQLVGKLYDCLMQANRKQLSVLLGTLLKACSVEALETLQTEATKIGALVEYKSPFQKCAAGALDSWIFTFLGLDDLHVAQVCFVGPSQIRYVPCSQTVCARWRSACLDGGAAYSAELSRNSKLDAKWVRAMHAARIAPERLTGVREITLAPQGSADNSRPSLFSFLGPSRTETRVNAAHLQLICDTAARLPNVTSVKLGEHFPVNQLGFLSRLRGLASLQLDSNEALQALARSHQPVLASLSTLLAAQLDLHRLVTANVPLPKLVELEAYSGLEQQHKELTLLARSAPNLRRLALQLDFDEGGEDERRYEAAWRAMRALTSLRDVTLRVFDYDIDKYSGCEIGFVPSAALETLGSLPLTTVTLEALKLPRADSLLALKGAAATLTTLRLENVTVKHPNPAVEVTSPMVDARVFGVLRELPNLTCLRIVETATLQELADEYEGNSGELQTPDAGILELIVKSLPKLQKLELSAFKDYSPLAALPALTELDLSAARMRYSRTIGSLLKLPPRIRLVLRGDWQALLDDTRAKLARRQQTMPVEQPKQQAPAKKAAAKAKADASKGRKRRGK